MGFFISLWYLMRSFLLRGILNTILLFKDEARWDKTLGIHTRRFKKSRSREYFHYQGAGYKLLFKLFSALDPGIKHYRFVDIGSGLGRAVFVAEQCGFTKLVGIELDKDLYEEAGQNLHRFTPSNPKSEICFIHQNALEASYENSRCVYFLFNPFNRSVLEQVLRRIQSGTQEDTWFIYMNPLFREAFQSPAFEHISTFKTRFYTEAMVFRLRPKA